MKSKVSHPSGAFLCIERTNVEQNTAFLKRNRLLGRSSTTERIIPTETFPQNFIRLVSRLFKDSN